ncbi:MAG: hypothetical protein E7164_04605 [Firmicutes bacterium]|nr:hypothetical protein [Bacillota bacterium]
MFPSPQNGLSLIRILGGINKTLSIAREVIPIYEQAKPMVQNARKAFDLLKSINSTQKYSKQPISQDITPQNKRTMPAGNSSVNNPSFFK